MKDKQFNDNVKILKSSNNIRDLDKTQDEIDNRRDIRDKQLYAKNNKEKAKIWAKTAHSAITFNQAVKKVKELNVHKDALTKKWYVSFYMGLFPYRLKIKRLDENKYEISFTNDFGKEIKETGTLRHTEAVLYDYNDKFN